jgi:hypothetical protein
MEKTLPYDWVWHRLVKVAPLLRLLLNDHDMLGLQTCISYVLEGFGNVPAWESLLC